MLNCEFTWWCWGFLCLDEVDDDYDFTLKHRAIIKAHIELCKAVEKDRLTISNVWILENIAELSLSQLLQSVQATIGRMPSPKQTDIAYFLQGFFEITGATTLSHQQRNIIMQVFESNDLGLGPQFIAIYKELREIDDQRGYTMDATKYKDFLNALFVHVIDNTYGGSEEDKQKWQSIHDGE